MSATLTGVVTPGVRAALRGQDPTPEQLAAITAPLGFLAGLGAFDSLPTYMVHAFRDSTDTLASGVTADETALTVTSAGRNRRSFSSQPFW